MRYSASEKFEIIKLVEQSSLSIRRTLVPDRDPKGRRYLEGGIEALEERRLTSTSAEHRPYLNEGSHQTKDHRAKTPPASAGNRSLNLQTR